MQGHFAGSPYGLLPEERRERERTIPSGTVTRWSAAPHARRDRRQVRVGDELSWEYTGKCGFAADFDYSSDE